MQSDRSAKGFEGCSPRLNNPKGSAIVLRLYINGLTPRSTRAINNLKDLCANELAGRYEVEIIDISKQPELAKADNIVAIPTLVKRLPKPFHQLIGDLSDREKVLIALDLRMAK